MILKKAQGLHRSTRALGAAGVFLVQNMRDNKCNFVSVLPVMFLLPAMGSYFA